MKNATEKKRSTKHRTDSAAKRVFLPAAAVFAFAITVRAVYLYQSSDNPTFYAPVVDSLTYEQMAITLVDEGKLTDDFSWQPIFYPMMLAGVYKLSGSIILPVKVIQAVLGAATCVLVFFLGKRLFSVKGGLIAAAITAAYMPLVFFEGELLAAGWAAFWAVALVLVFLQVRENPSLLRFLLLGFCGIMSIITRPEFFPFFVAACAWLAACLFRDKVPPAKIALGAVAALIGFWIIGAPVEYLSYRVTGRARLMPHSGGINLYIGNNPNYSETINTRPGIGWKKLTELPKQHGITERFAMEQFFLDKTVVWAKGHPLDFAKGMLYKTAQFANSREMPRNVDIYLFRQWSSLLKAGIWKLGRFGFPFGLLFPLAVLGLLSHWRKWPGVVWLFILLYPTAIILVFVASRYRVPVTGIAAVLAAAGILSLRDVIKAKQWPALAVVAAACAVCWGAGQFYEEKLDYEPELYYGLGDSRDKHGDTMAGIEAYQKAIELRRDYVEAQHNLGLLLFEVGQPEQAAKHYLIALESDPNNAGIHDDLGMVYVAANRPHEAIEEYKKAIALDPENSRPYDNMGTALLNVNKTDEAIACYKKAAELSPDDPITHNNLGNVYALTGNPQEAVKHYKISLESAPDEADTLCNMANALASLKRYKEAEDAYRRSIEIDPKNPGTHVNLGLCLESQKKLEQARAQYEAALRIDPTHKTANLAIKRLK